MLILGKVKLSKNWNRKEVQKLTRTFSMFYVRSLFKNSRNIKYKQEVNRLLQTQNYIKQYYNTKTSILQIILNILHNIQIDNNGLLYINKEQINTIKVNEIYKLICFGNLQVQKSAIFYDAINFGIKQMRMIKNYGC